MKLHSWNVGTGLFAFLLVMSFLPRSARADFVYSFSGSNFVNGNNNTFSITEPSLITTTGAFNVSFKIGKGTFTSGYFDAATDCFTFSTSTVVDCDSSATGDSFFANFSGATAPGTYAAGLPGCGANNGGPCEILESLTISGSSSATPEPSSLILLGSGLLGVAGTLRRKWRR